MTEILMDGWDPAEHKKKPIKNNSGKEKIKRKNEKRRKNVNMRRKVMFSP